jgi:hypothetical protein
MNSGKDLPDNDLSAQVIAAGIKVHKALGLGFLQSLDEEALCIQLEPIHISFVRSYMKAVDADAGMIVNFSTMPLSVKRVGREYQASTNLSFSQ